MIIEVDDDGIKKENVKKYIIGNNINLVSVCDHIDFGTNEQVGNENTGNEQVGNMYIGK